MFSAPHKPGNQRHPLVETGEYLQVSKDSIVSERGDVCFSRLSPGIHVRNGALPLISLVLCLCYAAVVGKIVPCKS